MTNEENISWHMGNKSSMMFFLYIMLWVENKVRLCLAKTGLFILCVISEVLNHKFPILVLVEERVSVCQKGKRWRPALVWFCLLCPVGLIIVPLFPALIRKHSRILDLTLGFVSSCLQSTRVPGSADKHAPILSTALCRMRHKGTCHVCISSISSMDPIKRLH